MKKQYETPKAEKLVFDYAESVEACWWSLMRNCYQQGNNNQQAATTNPPTTAKSSGIKYNNDPNGQYYKCLATYYHNCW